MMVVKRVSQILAVLMLVFSFWAAWLHDPFMMFVGLVQSANAIYLGMQNEKL